MNYRSDLKRLKLYRVRRRLKPFWDAYMLWLRFDCIDLSAAFAYHTLQSFFPALLIALSFASRLLGQDGDLLYRLVDLVNQILPASAALYFVDTLNRFTRQGFGAGILGVVLLFWSSNNIYLTLQRGADRIWWNRPHGFDGLLWHELVWRFLGLRLKAFLLLILIGLMMVVDQLISNIRLFGSADLHKLMLSALPVSWRWFGSVSLWLDVSLSFVISFFTMLIFLWLLPSRRVPLDRFLPGALLVSACFTLINLLLGRSLMVLGLRFQAYGVVGGVLVLTLWVWLLGVIIYYGQCLSVVFAGRGSGGGSTLQQP